MRRLRHFFCFSPSFEKDQKVHLESDETHHLKNVLRLVEGDGCLLSNGKGLVAEAMIESFTKKGEAELVVKKVLPPETAHDLPEIKIYFALPQKGKADSIVEKAQEVGIAGAYPLETKRTVLKVAANSGERMLSRWQKIIKNAAKQSRAFRLLDVRVPRKIGAALKEIPSDEEIIVLHPAEGAESFQEWILDKRSRASRNPVNVFIGPEGGFSEDEIELITEYGAKKISLNSNILRVETATVGIAASLKFLL